MNLEIRWHEEIDKIVSDKEASQSLKFYVSSCLKKDIPVIINLEHLALLVGVEYLHLKRMVNSSDSFYYEFEMPKRSGGFRTIHKPYPSLQAVQDWIYQYILKSAPIHPKSIAFVPGKSIVDHAKPHIDSVALCLIDIKDFFPTIRLNRVISLFQRIGYPNHIALFLGMLCTKTGFLPQGASTSPAISNGIFIKTDKRIDALAKKLNCNYSRYADDIAISGKFVSHKIIQYVGNILAEEGFIINRNKSRLIVGKHKQKIITGISISSGSLKLPRRTQRQWRKEVYFILRHGLEAHLEKNKINDPIYINRVLGKLYFWKQIEPDNEFVLNSIKEIEKSFFAP